MNRTFSGRYNMKNTFLIKVMALSLLLAVVGTNRSYAHFSAHHPPLSVDVQLGFGENMQEVLSWGGNDALLYGWSLGLRWHHFADHWTFCVSWGRHTQFLANSHPRWTSIPVVATYQFGKFYAEGGLICAFNTQKTHDETFRLGGIVGAGYLIPLGYRTTMKVGLSQSLVEEKTRVYSYGDDGTTIPNGHRWYVDGDLRINLTLQYMF